MDIKASFKNILINVIIISLFSFIILLLTNQELKRSIIVVIVIIGAYLFILLIDKRPINIKIEHSNLIITYNQFLVHKTQVSEGLKELTQSFKKEVGPRGSKRMVYKIYKGNQVILKIIPNYNGWSTNKILTLRDNLQKLGVILIDQRVL